MAQYKINDTTLTAIGDAIRNKSGEFTKIGLVPMDVPIVYDVIIPVGGRIENIITDSVIINNVAKVKILFTFNYGSVLSHSTDGIGIFNDNTSLGTVRLTSGKNQEVEYQITGGIAKIRFTSSTPYTQYGVKIEVYYYDIDNNLITTHEGEVPNTMTPAQMADAIEAIEIVDVEELSITTNGTYTAPEGVGYSPVVVNVDGALPAEAFNITGDCSYKFAYSGWNWFINTYGNQIITKDISSAYYMFNSNATLTEIPFVINLKQRSISGGANGNGMFDGMSKLRTFPKVTGSFSAAVQNMCRGCSNLREISDASTEELDFSLLNESTSSSMRGMFQYCMSLRSISNNLISKLYNKATSGTYSPLAGTFDGCYSIDELLNIPVPIATHTANMMGSMLNNCCRIKNFTFAIQEDGTPYSWNAKAQVLDLSTAGNLQNAYSDRYVTDYNSGITADKKVWNEDTYQALKDDLDWFSANVDYSRYNHDSAVNTINSLPDTSAYLATAGGTNTIKFRGAAGAKTDGGAINTLTEEEIAVATAKGWTVTLA